MSCYLRFSREDYEAIARAYRPLPPAGSYRAFRSSLTSALRQGRPDLAERVAGFNDRQVGLLRGHLERPGPPAGEDVLAARRLTWREWQEVARAGAAFSLLGGGLGGFRGFLLRQVGASSALGGKLARLDEAQVVRLYLGVRSGRRCCP